MVENFTYVGKKRLSPPKKLSVTISKIAQIAQKINILVSIPPASEQS